MGADAVRSQRQVDDKWRRPLFGRSSSKISLSTSSFSRVKLVPVNRHNLRRHGAYLRIGWGSVHAVDNRKMILAASVGVTGQR